LVEFYGKTSPETEEIEYLKDELIFRFNLSSDISDFLKQFKNDKILKPAIEYMFGARPSCAYNLYEFLIVSTLLQNTVVRRSISMLDNLISNYGKILVFNGIEVGVLFEPEKMSSVSEESLRELKLGYRAKTIKRISDVFVHDITLEKRLRKMNKEDVKKELMKIYGVGPQTVGYLLFEYFHFFDALDHISPWESKILGQIIFDQKDTMPDKILQFLNQKYGPWRALAAHYLFENLFWQHRSSPIGWLSKEIRT
jgi:3-methyladenine DNA glycosylase/8-oxoguanine DNA glycosylase